ncbi:hypothetical protein KFE80_04265 [bacterium SCSIO 12696]|nr:hypothetical protein KFE80_04265 [bacterium SCSIO 12696]
MKLLQAIALISWSSFVLSAEVFKVLPENCQVIEAFTLFSIAPRLSERVSELEKEVPYEFDGLIFSKQLYEAQVKIEKENTEKQRAKQAPDLIVHPNFYGVPKGHKEYLGVLVICS